MAENFSFSVTDIQHIICNTDKFVKGITKVMAVFYSEKINGVKAIEVESPFMLRNFSDIPFDNKETLEEIEKLRNDHKIKPFWFTSHNLPLVKMAENIIQLEVFDENDRHILMITVKNEFDKKNDLIFYDFNKNLSNFKPSDTQTPMDQNNKIVIETMMYNMANLMAETCRNDRKALTAFTKDVGKTISQMRTNEELSENVILNYVNNILIDLSSKSGKYTFILSEKAKSKLKSYKGELLDLNRIMKHASKFAANLNVDVTNAPIKIQDFHLDFDLEIISEAQQPSVKMDESKYDKIIAWLDRLEASAQIVSKNKLPMTGPNIGNFSLPRVSAAAISEYLHKHLGKVKKVLEEHPDNWEIVRYEFKPLSVFLIPAKKEKTDKDAMNKQA